MQLRTKKHEVFTRQGADLGMNHVLSLREALLGYEIRVHHVSGSLLIIRNGVQGEVVQPGQLKRVMTYGMPQRGAPHIKGHLYIVMDVELPLSRSLSQSTVKKLRGILPDLPKSAEGEEKDSGGDASSDKSSEKSTGGGKGKGGGGKGKGGFAPGFLQKGKGKGGKGKKGRKGRGKRKDKDEDEDSEMIDVVTTEDVDVEDGKLKATPASANTGAYHEDDDDGGVQCHQM